MSLSKKVSLFYLVLSAIASGLITYFGTSYYYSEKVAVSQNSDTSNIDDYKINRDPANYKYISPIISIEHKNESERYADLKTQIEQYIYSQKQAGNLIAGSVYVRNFLKGEWFAINVSENYNPGSLLKVGVLITYFRMAENDPNLLNMEVVYQGNKKIRFPDEYYKSDTVIEGKKYKINELLEYMIKYSDNRATVFLENHMDTTIFKKEFDDLGITRPRFTDPNYALNVKEYSSMFMALYNAGYLKRQASENALGFLTESTFRQGILKELPKELVCAHKFGEAGDQKIHELHECGIVYLHNNPYLITVMTEGNNWEKLSDALGHISKIVYDKMVQQPIQ